MPTYEVSLYNQHVRDCLKTGDSHKTYSDDWGDSHYIEFSGQDEDTVRRKVETRYPADDGFVIESVLPL